MTKWSVKLADKSNLTLEATRLQLYSAEEPVIAFENMSGDKGYPVHMIPVRQVAYIKEVES